MQPQPNNPYATNPDLFFVVAGRAVTGLADATQLATAVAAAQTDAAQQAAALQAQYQLTQIGGQS